MYTVMFAKDRSECGAQASFKFRYEAEHFCKMLEASGYWFDCTDWARSL